MSGLASRGWRGVALALLAVAPLSLSCASEDTLSNAGTSPGSGSGSESEEDTSESSSGTALRLDPGEASPLGPPSRENRGASGHVVHRDSIVPVDDLVFLEEALEELIRRCMDERGFRYVPNEIEGLRGPLDNLGILALQSREQAEQWGYGGPSEFGNQDGPGGSGPSLPDPNRDYLQQLSQADVDAWMNALMGSGIDITEAEAQILEAQHEEQGFAEPEMVEMWVSNDGCIGIGESSIYGDLGEFMRLNNLVRSSLRGEVQARIKAAPAFVDAVAEWAVCMQGLGYGFDDPSSARRAVSRAYAFESLEAAMGQEAAIASADGRCSEESGLFEVVDTEMARALAAVTAEREGEILGYRELITTAVKTAKSLLDAP